MGHLFNFKLEKKMKTQKKESFVKVKALQTGYYGEERRRAGDVFVMKSKDFYKYDAKGNRVIEMATDEETGEEYKAYVTTTWVDLLEDDYNPEKDVEKPVKKSKVRIGPTDSNFPAPEPARLHTPESANPTGFAPSPKPVMAQDADHVADAPAPTAKKVPVQAADADVKPAGKSNKSDKQADDVI